MSWLPGTPDAADGLLQTLAEQQRLLLCLFPPQGGVDSFHRPHVGFVLAGLQPRKRLLANACQLGQLSLCQAEFVTLLDDLPLLRQAAASPIAEVDQLFHGGADPLFGLAVADGRFDLPAQGEIMSKP